MTSTGATKKLLLKSSDGVIFEVDEAVAIQSCTLRHIIEDGCADTTIPVENVTSEVLTKVLEYCKNHVGKEQDAEDVAGKMEKLEIEEGKEETGAEKELKGLDEKFIDVGTDMLYDVIMAANFLDIKGLLDLACEKVANMIKGKKPDEIRDMFGIEKDFTEEEEEQILREQSWAFDS